MCTHMQDRLTKRGVNLRSLSYFLPVEAAPNQKMSHPVPRPPTPFSNLLLNTLNSANRTGFNAPPSSGEFLVLFDLHPGPGPLCRSDSSRSDIQFLSLLGRICVIARVVVASLLDHRVLLRVTYRKNCRKKTTGEARLTGTARI